MKDIRIMVRPGPIIPTSKEQWNNEYAAKRWEYLRDPSESVRYGVILGYIVAYQKCGLILDVGCGEGILLDYLLETSYKDYVGIDISRVAVLAARRKSYARARFMVRDAAGFVPHDLYDVIVFNESLYYLPAPLEVLRRYRSRLTHRGIIIVSIFVSSRQIEDLDALMISSCNCLERVRVQNAIGEWRCTVLS